jgi:hypothetical protein
MRLLPFTFTFFFQFLITLQTKIVEILTESGWLVGGVEDNFSIYFYKKPIIRERYAL